MTERTQVIVATVLLLLTGLLFAGMVHAESEREAARRAAGINIMQMIEEAEHHSVR